jgi:predicted transcriptional regulator
MSQKTLTITLPADTTHALESIGKRQRRRPFDLVLEAVRAYVNIPAVAATKADLQAIRVGRKEFERGEHVSLDHVLNALAARTRPVSRKGAQ